MAAGGALALTQVGSKSLFRLFRLFRLPPAQGYPWPREGRSLSLHGFENINNVWGPQTVDRPRQMRRDGWSLPTQRGLGHGGSCDLHGARGPAPARTGSCSAAALRSPRREDCPRPCSTPKRSISRKGRLTPLMKKYPGLSPPGMGFFMFLEFVFIEVYIGAYLFAGRHGLSPTGTTQPYSVALPPVRVGRAPLL